jgi:putative membrane protein
VSQQDRGPELGGPPPEGAGGWQHLHPLSPLLRGGFVMLALGGWLVTQGVDSVMGTVSGDYTGDPQTQEVFAHPIWFGLGALGIVAVIAGGSWLSWRFARFRVSADQVELRTGVLFRQHRQVRFERVQAVEISRPLLARVFGLAQVIVQSAGGRGSHLTLSFLALARAHELRDHLLALAGRSDEEARAARPDGIPGPPADLAWGGPLAVADDRSPGERPVLAVPNARLFVATLLHTSTLILGLGVLLGSAAAGLGTVGVLTGLLPMVIGIGGNRVGELLKHGNFTLAELPDSLRIRHGLTDLRTTTVPLHRLQAVEVLQPMWWRPLGWWRVRVNVAGVHDEPGSREDTTVLPVGTFADVTTVLGVLDAHVAAESLDAAVLGSGAEPGWTAAGERSRLLDPLSWRRNGYAVSPSSVITRRGRLHRAAVVIPHARIQSLTLSQGVLERALGLASVTLVSTPGPVHPAMPHLTVAEAERLLNEEAFRARVARRRRVTTCEPGPEPSGLGPAGPQPAGDPWMEDQVRERPS